ncbi:DEAD/DEAH box helicase [Patescibacteria group bacterium]|nr:DEAD/DEAH box helicase [Patescibacteria group bacterium]
MYKTNSRPSGSNSRFSSNKKGGFRKSSSTRTGQFNRKPKSGGSSRFSGGYKGGNQGRNRSRFSKTSKLDISTFINKAQAIKPDEKVFEPKNSFASLPIENILKENILRKNYQKPTPIQDESILHILEGKDIVGLANTGTGKTAAFLIPLINKVILNSKEQIIILTPTRELAIQIEDELKSFIDNIRIYSTVCVGGAPIYKQIQKLKKPNQFVIGTPGRVMDLMKRKVLNVKGFKTIVLDEADRMLDMGFVNDMRFIMAQMPKERHTLFFSATMSSTIEELIKDFLNNPVNISVKTRDVSKNIDQDVIRMNGQNKLDVLANLLSDPKLSKVLVFGRTKHGVEKLNKQLLQLGVRTESIHGNKTHGQRQRSLQRFKTDSVQTLIATDVVARGLDINNVSHVINYDLPETYDDYVHRIGRTGRANKTGKALTFID